MISFAKRPGNILFDAITEHKLYDESTLVQQLIDKARLPSAEIKEIQRQARTLMQQVRRNRLKAGGIDALMAEYDLSSSEGIALMCLAEALLRIPDGFTADRLIHDKICQANWQNHVGESDSLFVNATTWGLLITGKILKNDHYSSQTLQVSFSNFVARSSKPIVRSAVMKAM